MIPGFNSMIFFNNHILYCKMALHNFQFVYAVHQGLVAFGSSTDQQVLTLASPFVTHASEMCLTFQMKLYVGMDWRLVMSLYQSGDTDTPSRTFGYFMSISSDLDGMVSLPVGNYRVVFSSHGVWSDFVRLKNVSLTEGACSEEG